MLNKLLLNTSRLFIFSIFFVLVSCQTEISNKAEKVQYLRNIGKSIAYIDPVETDFSDVDFLRNTLKGVDIVMLGEVSHADGSSLQAKTRLVKFLHQQLGFEVLVFESGLLECNYAWGEYLKSELPPDTAFSRGVFPVWANSLYVNELIQYIGRNVKTNHPLELAGMDIQLTGNLSVENRRKLYTKHLASIDTTILFSE